MTSTITRLVTGILNQQMMVEFVLAEWNPESQENETIEETVAVTGLHISVLSIQEEFQSIYDEIVQPDVVIVVPGYFTRYIPLLGLELACFQTTRRLKKER